MHKTTNFGTSTFVWAIFSWTYIPPWLVFIGFFVSFIHREGNFVVHSLARFAKHISDDVIWIEDSPPPALESLYFNLAHIAS